MDVGLGSLPQPLDTNTGVAPSMPSPDSLMGPRKMGLSDDQVIEVWQTRRQISQQMRDAYEPQWVKNWKMYRAYMSEMSDPADWWRSNVFIPEMFNSIETILPRTLLGMFNKPEWFNVRCPHYSLPGHPGIPCEDYEKLVQSLLLYGTRRMNLFETAYMGHKYGSIMGHAWFKLRWEREIVQKPVDMPVTDPMSGDVLGMSSALMPYVAYDDPKLDFVSNFRVWADPTGNDDWFIEEIETTLEKLEALNQQLGIYKNLGVIAASGITDRPLDPMNRNTPYSGGSSYREANITSVEGFSNTVRDESYDGTKVTLLVCTGRVPYTPTDGATYRRTVIANDQTIIRDGVNPTPDMKPEIFGVQSIPIPGFVYGDSVIRYAGPLNEQLNRIENFRMDEVVLGIWQQYIANRNAVTSNQLLFQPGGIVFVDTPNDVRTAFDVLKRVPILPQAYQESSVKRDQIERTTGATAAQQGSQPSDRETATSFQGRTQLGNERFRLMVMWQNMAFKRPLLQRMFALYQRHLPPDRLVRIVGEDYQVPLDISMIQDDVDIDIDADIYEIDSAAKSQAFAFFLQTAAAPPFAPFWKVPELLSDAVESYLQKDGRRYVKTEEEVQMQMAAQAQAALFSAISAQHTRPPTGSGPAQGGGPSPGGRPALPAGQFGGAQQQAGFGG